MTDLFPMSINPVRVGVYQVIFATRCEKAYSRWDGNHWRAVSDRVPTAVITPRKSNWCYDGYVVGWQGLTKDEVGNEK